MSHIFKRERTFASFFPLSSNLLSFHFGGFPPFVSSYLTPCMTLPLPCSSSNCNVSHFNSPTQQPDAGVLPGEFSAAVATQRELQSSRPRSGSLRPAAHSCLCPSLHIIYTVWIFPKCVHLFYLYFEDKAWFYFLKSMNFFPALHHQLRPQSFVQSYGS